MIRVYRADIRPPHDKFCICLCPERCWFFYINSNPPPFRKAREVAVQVENFEAAFLSHTSFIDVSVIIDDLPPGSLADALNDRGRLHGALAPFLVSRIKGVIPGVASLTDAQKAEILL